MTTYNRNPILARLFAMPMLAILSAVLLLAPPPARAEKFVIAWSAVSALNRSG